MTYVNTNHGPGKATFVDVTSNPGFNNTLNFSAKETGIKIGTKTVKMENIVLTGIVPFSVMECEGTCPVGELNASFKITANVPRGDSTKLTAVQNEVLRVLALWVATGALQGIVPPATADFAASGG